MLIEFKVSNYRSIADEQILSLVPSNKPGDASDNIFVSGKYSALNTVAVYGANASGKSNLLLAMSLLDKLVHLSSRSSSTTKLPYDPFLLRKGYESKPTRFEITFILNEKRYRYGLEFFADRIVEEWLYRKNVGREVVVFLREDEVIDVSSAFQGSNKLIDTAIDATRQNALFLSTCDMFNVDEAKEVFQWFTKFQMVDGLNTKVVDTASLLEDKEYQGKINSYMTKLGLGLVGIDVDTKDFDSSGLPKNMTEKARSEIIKHLSGAKQMTINAKHHIYSEEGYKTTEFIQWDFGERESAGANQALHLSGNILWVLSKGGTLIIDEIEAKLHPIMTLETIRLFLNKETNPHKAQLIFATHDTNLLTYSNLRRDQIYLTEKNNWEATEIYSLSDIVYLNNSKERSDTDKEKRYLEGRYGGIPFLSDFQSIKTIINGTEG